MAGGFLASAGSSLLTDVVRGSTHRLHFRNPAWVPRSERWASTTPSDWRKVPLPRGLSLCKELARDSVFEPSVVADPLASHGLHPLERDLRHLRELCKVAITYLGRDTEPVGRPAGVAVSGVRPTNAARTATNIRPEASSRQVPKLTRSRSRIREFFRGGVSIKPAVVISGCSEASKPDNPPRGLRPKIDLYVMTHGQIGIRPGPFRSGTLGPGSICLEQARLTSL